MMSPTRRALRSRLARLRQRGREIHYFHEVDEPYSQLACQTLATLTERYDARIVRHLATREDGLNRPEPELLSAYARRDVASVAGDYGLRYADPGAPPAENLVRRGEAVLAAALESDRFFALAPEIGRAVWAGDDTALTAIEAREPSATPAETAQQTAAGRALRERWGHYSGATFLYAGEWFWGVDRLHLLERRLRENGATSTDVAFPYERPAIDAGSVPDTGRILLEYFPSLRSPYTAVAHQPTLDLAATSGVRFAVRPVMPMVMRGVPVTMTKGMYIMEDARREAEVAGIPFGNLHDPIGRPVENGFALWAWAEKHGRGTELLTSFLRSAFTEAVRVDTDAGLQHVVEAAGLSWEDARHALADEGWRDVLERNRLFMVDELGIWGVPSYRVSGPDGEADYATWGNDRLWKVAREIRRRIALP